MGSAILVAVVNEGTLLGAPENWKTLLDAYTNLAVHGCNVLALFPQATAAAKVLKELIADLGAFLKALANQAVDDSVAPGLAAMRPDGAFIAKLNAVAAVQPTLPHIRYYAVTSEFDMHAPNEENEEITLSERILETVASQFLNQVIRENHDLVVNTLSMAAHKVLPDNAPAPFLTDSFPFGRTRRVYHTTYFTRPETTRAITGWLGFAAAGEVLEAFRRGPGDNTPLLSFEDLAASEPPASAFDSEDSYLESREVYTEIGFAPTIEHLSPVDRSFHVSPRVSADPVRRGGKDLRATPEPTEAAAPMPSSTTTCSILAEMPDVVFVGTPAMILVSLSRDEVVALMGSRTLDQIAVEVALDAPLIMQAVPKQNLELATGSTGLQTVSLPPPGEKLLLAFLVQGTAPGDGEVGIFVTQNQTPIAVLILTPRVKIPTQSQEEPNAVSVPSVPIMAEATELPPAKPLQKPLFQMFVFERKGANGSVSFQYLIQSPTLNIVKLYTSPDLGEDREGYVNAIYKEIEAKWDWGKAANDAFRAALQAIGVELFRRLFPPELREFLWKHRDAITDVMVVSYEPFIPWEIVHLRQPVPPNEPPVALDPNESAFLGDMGLVRWLDGSWPPDTLRIRPDKAYVVIPNYSGRLDLKSAQSEKKVVNTLFSTAQSVTPEVGEIQKLLRNRGGLDLFHYAGHGLADSENISQAGLVLEILPTAPSKDKWKLLKPRDVANGALWSTEGRAIVFLNACQIAREGYSLGQPGGFAKAFLDAGAGAFIGPLWSVLDSTALSFVTAFYQHLYEGKTLGEATREARKAAENDERDNNPNQWASGTHLAYAVYGHPQATLSNS